MESHGYARGEKRQIARWPSESLRAFRAICPWRVQTNERKKPPAGFKKNEVFPELRLTPVGQLLDSGQAPRTPGLRRTIYRSIKDEGISQRAGRAAVLPPEII